MCSCGIEYTCSDCGGCYPCDHVLLRLPDKRSAQYPYFSGWLMYWNCLKPNGSNGNCKPAFPDEVQWKYVDALNKESDRLAEGEREDGYVWNCGNQTNG